MDGFQLYFVLFPYSYPIRGMRRRFALSDNGEREILPGAHSYTGRSPYQGEVTLTGNNIGR